MPRVLKLRKGYDIKIKGKAKRELKGVSPPKTFALKPTDFMIMSPIPKLLVAVGDEVKAGDGIFYDKTKPEIIYTSPVSGEIADIVRGENRSIAEVVILADKIIKYTSFEKLDPKKAKKEKIISILLESGLWPVIIQRPFGVVANPDDSPRSVYISCFDTSPLAVDMEFVMQGEENNFKAGIEILAKLTEGQVHLGLHADQIKSQIFTEVDDVVKHWFEGPHPVGNVGIQLHHTDPVKKGDIVWSVAPQDVATIGRLFLSGEYHNEKVVAIAGSEVKNPIYFKTMQGANIENFVKNNTLSNNVRYISGNVLTGSKINENGYMGYYDNLLSIIAEGDQFEFMGWLIPNYAKPSISRSFISGWLKVLSMDKEYSVNTNTHGEERAFVVSGQYEEVTPMDIYPVQLIKSIMYKDFDEMEGLGIYEVIEEDLALCEFVCTSKVDVQAILREGLDLMRTEG